MCVRTEKKYRKCQHCGEVYLLVIRTKQEVIIQIQSELQQSEGPKQKREEKIKCDASDKERYSEAIKTENIKNKVTTAEW